MNDDADRPNLDAPAVYERAHANAEFLDALSDILGINHPVVARDLAESVCEAFGTYTMLHRVERRELMSINGIGPVRAARIHAAYRFAEVFGHLHRRCPVLDRTGGVDRLISSSPPGQRAIVAQVTGHAKHDRVLASGPSLDFGADIATRLATLSDRSVTSWTITFVREAGVLRSQELQAAQEFLNISPAFSVAIDTVFISCGPELWWLGASPRGC